MSQKMLQQVDLLRPGAEESVKKGVSRRIGELAKSYADYGEGRGLTELIEKDVASYVSQKESVTGLKYLDELARKIEEGAYKGAGTRTARFMRKEFLTGERNPPIVQAWDRVGKSVDAVNARLSEAGFEPIRLQDPEVVSESFALELSEKWPKSFATFRRLADEAARQLEGAPAAPQKKAPARKRSGKKATGKTKGKGRGKRPKAG